MGERRERCETCRWWAASVVAEIATTADTEHPSNLQSPTYGNCHAHPRIISPYREPKLLVADSICAWAWPVQSADDWCGEWQPLMPTTDGSKDDREIVFDLQKRLDTKDTRVVRAVEMVRKHKPNGYTADDICRMHRIPHNAKLWKYVHEAWEALTPPPGAVE
jgi:hypothetical protein